MVECAILGGRTTTTDPSGDDFLAQSTDAVLGLSSRVSERSPGHA